MRRLLLATLLLTAGPAHAQVSFGVSHPGGISFQPPPAREPGPPRVSPVTPIVPAPPSPPPDLFRAASATYAPAYGRAVPIVVGTTLPGGYTMLPERIVERTIVVVSAVAADAAMADKPAAPVPIVARPAPLAGHRRTLYVIPGCYAGDTPPAAGRLRDGCSLDDLRRLTLR